MFKFDIYNGAQKKNLCILFWKFKIIIIWVSSAAVFARWATLLVIDQMSNIRIIILIDDYYNIAFCGVLFKKQSLYKTPENFINSLILLAGFKLIDRTHNKQITSTVKIKLNAVSHSISVILSFQKHFGQ